MKKLVLIACSIMLLACSSDDNSAIVPCTNGMAGIYPCNGYDLMASMAIDVLGGPGAVGNDSWGWTDPTNGKEFALVGTSTGTAFVDISSPTNPILLGTLPTATVNSSWRDIKVYQNHAFIVSEANGHGMQVFDLTRLRSVSNIPETFTADAHYTQFGNAHNIFINEASGFAYVIGSNTFSGGPHFINIQNPTNPQAAGGYSADSYSHDVQVLIYNGPDADHTGKEILIGSNENEVVIVDVTDKNNPTNISSIGYTNIGYTHQGWFTDDLKYFIVGDELDELNFGGNTRTLVFNLEDLDNPSYSFEYSGPTPAIDHNGYVHNGVYFQANYTRGVTMLDVTDIDNGSLTEIGYFDTYPADNTATFHGAWNVYPYFASGNIIISDIEGGLIIIRKSN